MEYKRKDLPEKVKKIGWWLVGSGLTLVFLSYIFDVHRSSMNNLIIFMFFASVSVGSILLIALEYLAGAVWSTPMRRVTEFIASSLPFAIIIALPLFFSLHDLFHWTHVEAVETDKILRGKSPYLNIPFFTIRFVIVFGIFFLFYKLFTRNSLKQDVTGDQKLTSINVKLSAVFMPLVAIGLSVLAIDWIMSLEPHWFSTIFGIYYITGTVLAGLGATTYAVVKLNENGYFTPALKPDHYYSLGALMFAFVNFWAYIAFSQFMLIWYANIPEETFWFMSRWSGNWKFISVAMIFVRFIIPYAGLLSQPSKMDPRRLKIMSLWILFSHFFDIYWLVVPNFSGEVLLSWYELGFPLLVIGIVMLVFYFKTKKYNLIPIKDPKLKRGMDFHL